MGWRYELRFVPNFAKYKKGSWEGSLSLSHYKPFVFLTSISFYISFKRLPSLAQMWCVVWFLGILEDYYLATEKDSKRNFWCRTIEVDRFRVRDIYFVGYSFLVAFRREKNFVSVQDVGRCWWWMKLIKGIIF
jgi:hypothetical protein